MFSGEKSPIRHDEECTPELNRPLSHGYSQESIESESMTRLNKISDRGMRVIGPSPRRRWDIAKWFAYGVANRRWIAEMRCEHGVAFLDEEDFDNAGLTTADDHRRAHEIEVEELVAVAHLDPNGPWHEPNAGSSESPTDGPDEASGMSTSDLLGVDPFDRCRS
jgi:hypothetical protein